MINKMNNDTDSHKRLFPWLAIAVALFAAIGLLLFVRPRIVVRSRPVEVFPVLVFDSSMLHCPTVILDTEGSSSVTSAGVSVIFDPTKISSITFWSQAKNEQIILVNLTDAGQVELERITSDHVGEQIEIIFPNGVRCTGSIPGGIANGKIYVGDRMSPQDAEALAVRIMALPPK
jgi:hypothetical protein